MDKKGFTLIEVLVVVLIIGILAAVVYPQYQAAVWKARVARLLPLGRNLAQQSQLFYEENGQYPTTREMVAFIPDSFKMQEQYLEEIDSESVFWENGQAEVYCANGNNEPTDCRLVGMEIKGDGWTDSLLLFFNARVDPAADYFLSHQMFCIAGSYTPGKEYSLTRKICKSLGGKLIPDTSFMFYID